jgi:hypothetical protein
MDKNPHDPRNWFWPFGTPESLRSKDEMAQKTVEIKRNKDNTITVKSGTGYVETINLAGKTRPERYESVRWAVITAGFEISPEIEALISETLDFA